MTPDQWEALGIAPTREALAIRRAYATRLRAIHPDDDPAAFATLRAAYEAAMAVATAPAPYPEPPGPVPSASSPLPVPPEPDPLGDALARHDAMGAAGWLLSVQAAGTLPLAEQLRLADELGWALALQTALPAEAVREAAGLLGWPQAGDAAPWFDSLRARLEAEAWLDDLRRDAASWTRWLGAARALAAVILLGQGRLRVPASMGGDRWLRRRYGEFLLHADWVGHRFDPMRLEAVDRLVGGGRKTRISKPRATLAIVMAFGSTASLHPGLPLGLAVLLLLVLVGRAGWRRVRRMVVGAGRGPD